MPCLAGLRFSSRTPPAAPAPAPLLNHALAPCLLLLLLLQEMGLAFDEWDLDYYTKLFKDDMKRDPTNVELFDIAQSNSEHSRHWFFRCGSGGMRGVTMVGW